MDQEQYRLAFVEYLRRGTPIRLGRKQVHNTEQYVWRTQDDDKVRPTHMANDGQLFSWDDLGIEVGGDPYDISGRWSASFTAEILVDSSENNYK